MHNPMEMNTYLTPSELATRLRLHPGTLARWRADGLGPGYLKIGSGHILYPSSEVSAWEISKQVLSGAM